MIPSEIKSCKSDNSGENSEKYYITWTQKCLFFIYFQWNIWAHFFEFPIAPFAGIETEKYWTDSQNIIKYATAYILIHFKERKVSLWDSNHVINIS